MIWTYWPGVPARRYLWRKDKALESHMLAKRERDIKYQGRVRDGLYPNDLGSMLSSLMMLDSWERERIIIKKGELK